MGHGSKMKLGVLFNTDRLEGAEFLRYAQQIDELGYESLWLPELFTRDPFAEPRFDNLVGDVPDHRKIDEQ